MLESLDSLYLVLHEIFTPYNEKEKARKEDYKVEYYYIVVDK